MTGESSAERSPAVDRGNEGGHMLETVMAPLDGSAPARPALHAFGTAPAIRAPAVLVSVGCGRPQPAGCRWPVVGRGAELARQAGAAMADDADLVAILGLLGVAAVLFLMGLSKLQGVALALVLLLPLPVLGLIAGG